MTSNTFIAQWSFKCTACGEWGNKGDEAMFTIAGDKVHVNCEEAGKGQFDLKAGESVCPKCFMTSCDCGTE